MDVRTSLRNSLGRSRVVGSEYRINLTTGLDQIGPDIHAWNQGIADHS